MSLLFTATSVKEFKKKMIAIKTLGLEVVSTTIEGEFSNLTISEYFSAVEDFEVCKKLGVEVPEAFYDDYAYYHPHKNNIQKAGSNKITLDDNNVVYFPRNPDVNGYGYVGAKINILCKHYELVRGLYLQ